ncbi:uncharacterized protein AMSG_01534 [Thecamonas trahens ATCC 50062]|uniref:Succinyl-CoA synthetase beta chain n=1 Tax=Thecamonas trahens ATCC 50062 TaxID=461836 RepID=A0A0L0DTA8_THETB|nr:hypothetical protein AMSG_01534 [Thecamonas trahens ATCC 50062]KNC54683.1 hypothetical protein AMSG_01534 [Thecamonas trahens ATCC 50062]|eukprot:XP_013761585.1 hypothetical protein AMSG_01534 [Thecamonas trahens ATCC 50062]
MFSLARTTLTASGAVMRPVLATAMAAPARSLNLHEYQSKELMQKAGLYIQQFGVAETPEEAEKVAANMVFDEGSEFVIKAMVHAGGRGKGVFTNGFKGGVHLAKTPEEVRELGLNMLGHSLVTKQTPAEGVHVGKIMVAEALDIDEEKYFAILMDREYNGPVLIASPQGGMDIEAVAEETPDAIMYEPVNINTGLTDEQLQRVVKFLKFKTETHEESAKEQIAKLYDMFLDVDATQIEINPLGTLETGRVLCFDAKVNFDPNAEFRQKDVFTMHDTSEDDPREVEAAKYDLNYIGMDGNIGALSTAPIALEGATPANFLDVGGGATEEQVEAALRIISSDTQVKAILVNIFGGIMRCSTIAKGLTSALESLNLDIPLVVRLEGTEVEEGNRILKESGFAITTATDLEDAAKKAVATL